MPGLLGRLDNIDVLVADLERMAPFYRDVLGLPLLFPYVREDELRPLPGVEPSFDLTGLERVELDVRLDAEAAGEVARLRTIDTLGAATDGEVVRAAFFRWWATAEAAAVPFAREE